VAISTEASIKRMLWPGAITIISPLVIGFAFGPEALGGFLAGATVSGVLMGMFQNNAGGAWDNAKKSFEKGVEINGEVYYKKSEPHKASVTGDTVGDPFKDTSGPSMNILIKLMSIVSLVIAPTLAQMYGGEAHSAKTENVEIKIEQKENAEGEKEVKFDNPFLSALHKDGLISDKSFRVSLKNDSLLINEVLQTKDVLEKYRSYLNGKTELNVEVNFQKL
jgi:K(+)-stimulated pyrophosphate-energized sodium pump